MEQKSFRLRYVGPRFDGHRLPLDVLSDLSAFRDLIASYAKADWRAAHSRRARLPKGFERSIAFSLVAIEDGCAIPRLEWDDVTAQRLLPSFRTEIEELVDQAYRKVVGLFDERADRPEVSELKSEQIRALNRFGSALLVDERIEFVGSHDASGAVVYVDTQRRRRLLTRQHSSYLVRVEGLGKLLGAEVDPVAATGTVVVATDSHGKLRIPMPPERVKEEFDGNLYSDVQFSLMMEIGANDVPGSIVEVFDADVVDDDRTPSLERCRVRIEELRQLDPGWNDGAGVAITDDAAAAASDLLRARPDLAGRCRIFPTDDGGLLIEFVCNGWDYGIEISAGGTVGLYGVQVNGPDELVMKTFDSPNHEFFDLLDRFTGERI